MLNIQVPPPFAPQITKINEIESNPKWQGLKILNAQADPSIAEKMKVGGYEFMSPSAGYTMISGILSKKGYIGEKGKPRVVITINPSLQAFVDLVKYDPSNPPTQDYYALGMKEMHERTQSDFKGQKQHNKIDFRDYILEGLRGDRTLFLPTISGWMSSKVFEKTVFVSFDETNPNALYGYMWLPRAPIMQADGQTQTAALFAVSQTIDAIDTGALSDLTVSLEIELNMDERKAGQSFADRNGRGSKKNKNLVISLDTSSALSELRLEASKGSVFEHRLATGRNTSTSETATTCIVDLSTMEQMILNVVSYGRVKPENFKHFHVPTFQPFVRDFLQMLDRLFKDKWLENTPPDSDPFRRIYVHGWAFALKAIALAYHKSRIHELGPLSAAIGKADAGKPVDLAYHEQVAVLKSKSVDIPKVTAAELEERLSKIKWERYRKHWISLTGAKMKDGKIRRAPLKSQGNELKAVGQAQNTAYIIKAVEEKILSSNWTELTNMDDA
ncbi:hypothetical protein [Pseudomonas oryzihabitans]|uniref:Uncharacterized protein n=1 Tax=Pseudomonas oryzihabitans TaxID=47885 RepID=A0ABX3IQJ4_9PSED|nr:hypothetical protein [Pseudomonas psychrotolerans]ONN70632.1 hypothetical protein BVL52_20570 [Pseudomonas psychrotolerans]